MTHSGTTLGERIRELRRQRELSLRDFAKLLNTRSKAHLSDIELGRRNPSAVLLRRIAAVLEVPFDELKRLDTRFLMSDLQRRVFLDTAFGVAIRQIIEDQRITGQALQFFLDDAYDMGER